MNAEVTAIVENKKDEEKGEESCTECVFMELGQATRDTKGSWVGYASDTGLHKRWE